MSDLSEREMQRDITHSELELLKGTTDDERAFTGTFLLQADVGPFARGTTVTAEIERGAFADTSMKMSDGKHFVYLFPVWQCSGGVYDQWTNEKIK